MNSFTHSRISRMLSFVGILAVTSLLSATALAGDLHGKVSVQGLRSAANIVVYVDIPGMNVPAPAQHAVMDQRQLKFVPHILVVVKGTTVDFLNSDNVGHNVYWPSISGNKGLNHNMGTWPQGIKKSFTYTTPGVVPLLCNVHAEMSGYIIVVPTPYYATTNASGEFVIHGVPAGAHTIKAWAEGGKPASQQVNVGAGTTEVNLTVTR
ncbi:MAG TPA: carboxypeptidase regulatory-like domain-containing protein [Blastocatellia bacterium]|nr:carboxypeptidase regulatory-like domain-containing protein [Blastocatellia bacterium]